MNNEQGWNYVKSEMNKFLNRDTYNILFKDSKIVNFNDNKVIIETKSSVSKEQLESPYGFKSQIEGYLTNFNNGTAVQIALVKLSDENKDGNKKTIKYDDKIHSNPYKNSNLNSSLTFDTLVQGESNFQAILTAHNLIDNIDSEHNLYNPLFIHGESGVGKSHLIHAIGNKINELYPKKVIQYIGTQDFINDYIDACSPSIDFNLTNFDEKYKNIDVLLIDDIQFLENTDKTQEKMFNIFENFINNNKIIIFTSDRLPNELDSIHERIKTRLSGALTISINVPDYETRIGILQNKMKIYNFDEIPEDVIIYIAKMFDTNARDLDGALKRVIHHSISYGYRDIDLQLAIECLKDLIKENKTKKTPKNIKRKVAEHFKITVKDLEGKSRKKEIAYARHVAIYLTSELLDMSSTKIGREFGNRDHTTVLHSIEKIRKEIENDFNLKFTIEKLRKTLS